MPVTHYLWTQSLTSVIYTLPTGNGSNYILHADRWLNLPKLDLAQSCDSTVSSGLRILSTAFSLFPLFLIFLTLHLSLLIKMCKNINFWYCLTEFFLITATAHQQVMELQMILRIWVWSLRCTGLRKKLMLQIVFWLQMHPNPRNNK